MRKPPFIKLLLLMALASSVANGQETGSKIIDDVTVETESDCPVARIHFTMPAFYLSHAPDHSGSALRIRLKLVPIDEQSKDFVNERRAVSLPRKRAMPVKSITYEGDADDGPHLTLQFEEPVKFSVEQSRDFRSVIIFTGDMDDADCPPSLSLPEHLGWFFND